MVIKSATFDRAMVDRLSGSMRLQTVRGGLGGCSCRAGGSAPCTHNSPQVVLLDAAKRDCGQ